MAPPDPNDADQRLGPLLGYFSERLNRGFAYFFFMAEFRKEEGWTGPDSEIDSRAWALRTMMNACLHETLLALRDINDFVRDKRSRPDDLRALDFGFTGGGPFLLQAEVESINKQVAHSTLTAAETPVLRWDVWEWTTKCNSQATAFLKWIEANYAGYHVFTAAIFCRVQTEKIFKWAIQGLAVPAQPNQETD